MHNIVPKFFLHSTISPKAKHFDFNFCHFLTFTLCHLLGDSVTCESNQDSVNDGKVDAFLIFLLNSSS